MVDKILRYHGQQLTPEQMFRLKSEALAFRGTLLYQLVTSKIPDEMQEEIVENCKIDEDLIYYRAILADRRMLEAEITAWADSKVTPPKLPIGVKLDRPLI